ncbi:uncharacterized protein LOC126570744 [Anopheles aquasalis]|uniref:uncharacterized protein LOC126570744 n=1 Tax=Anopheles aquasalis TaxID=42839 RepID=UPI00215B13D5|nr:uncharacterized protein LOC126570744 [Anopheles aquasalis]
MALKFTLFLVAAVSAASLQDYHQQVLQQHPSNQQQQQQQQQQQPNHQQRLHGLDLENRHLSTDNLYETDVQNRKEDQVGYDFSYSVHDPVTGDQKSQEESRRNGHVRGQYSWVDADGIRQIVDYRADDRTGFNAQQRTEPANRPRLNRILKLVPAQAVTPLYTIDTIIAPAYTSVSRVDQIRRNGQDSGVGRDEQHGDQQEVRDTQRDEQNANRDNRRKERRDERLDNASGIEDRREERHGNHRDDRREDRREERRDERRDDRVDDRRESHREDHREDDRRPDHHEEHRGDHADERRTDQRQETGDDRRLAGLGSGIQSEVHFQAPSVAYQYRN